MIKSIRRKKTMRIKELRKQKNITQIQLANYLGVVKSTISLYENENRMPDIETLNKLADYFNVSVDYLLGRNTTSAGDLPEGATETKKTSITPIEEQMLDIFREIGNKHGKEAQIALITVAEKML